MIQIDMNMPKCCDECDICYDGCYCPIARKPMNFETSGMQRMTDCPLQEVPDTNAGEWISVKDRMPEEDVDVLVSNGLGIEIAAYTTNPTRHWYGMSGNTAYAQYWMPLPTPPEEKRNDD